VRWLEVLATGLYWWHPVLWWARRRLHEAEEQCCDAWVVWARPDAVKSYAAALLDALAFVSHCGSNRSPAPIGASRLGGLKYVSRRITMIMKADVQRKLSWLGLSTVLALALLCLPWLPTWARLQDSGASAASASTVAAADPLPVVQDAPAKNPLARAAPVPDDVIQQAEDEVELAAAEVEIKKALLDKAISQRQTSRADLARLERLVQQGAMSREELEKVRSNVNASDAEIRVAEAEYGKAEILLNQAKRRLQRLKALPKTREPRTQAEFYEMMKSMAPPAVEAAPKKKGVDIRSTTPKASTTAAQERVIKNLKMIGLALHNHADTHDGHVPPPSIRSKEGKPLLSWRVAILPYLEQEALYREFHLDEPWDSEHNFALLSKMPPAFQTTGAAPGWTTVRGVVGKGYLFDPDMKDGTALRDILDGTSNTIAAVVANRSIPWTKPEEESEPLMLGVRFLALIADGSVRNLEVSDSNSLKALFTRAGGEVIDPARLAPRSADATGRVTLFDVADTAPAQIAELQAAVEALRRQVAALEDENRRLREELAKRPEGAPKK
jgi:hypothetical protein